MPADPSEVTRVPVAELAGTAMLAVVHAIPAVEAMTGRQATVIGGLAVLCRLGAAYRATSDLDTVNRRGLGDTPQLDIWFSDRKQHTLRLVRSIPEGMDLDEDTVQLTGELLMTELSR